MGDLMQTEVKYSVNGEDIKLTGLMVRSYLTRGNDTVTDQEVVMFINLCKYQKLNPFLNEAYLVKFKSNSSNPSQAQIIVSKEAYMKKAERANDYEGFRAGLILQRGEEIVEVEGSFALKNDVLLGGWAEVYKGNRRFPYIAKVGMQEYDKKQSIWSQKPNTMIRKVAIVQAMKEAFPEDLGALITEDEAQIDGFNKENLTPKQEIEQKANSKVIDIDGIDIDESEVLDAGQIQF